MHGNGFIQTSSLRQSNRLVLGQRLGHTEFTIWGHSGRKTSVYSSSEQAHLGHARRTVKPLVSAPPSTFDFRQQTKAETETIVREEYPELLDLANSGTGWYHVQHSPWWVGGWSMYDAVLRCQCITASMHDYAGVLVAVERRADYQERRTDGYKASCQNPYCIVARPEPQAHPTELKADSLNGCL